MAGESQAITILMAEDDPDDRILAKEAFEESRLANVLHFVEDGEELLEYLRHQGRYESLNGSPRPGLILLDLNMPRKDGREALKEIKGHPKFHRIPVVVLTTSKEEEDVVRSYDMGVSSFITKPVLFSSLIEVVKTLGKYWFEIVVLPGAQPEEARG